MTPIASTILSVGSMQPFGGGLNPLTVPLVQKHRCEGWKAGGRRAISGRA